MQAHKGVRPVANRVKVRAIVDLNLVLDDSDPQLIAERLGAKSFRAIVRDDMTSLDAVEFRQVLHIMEVTPPEEESDAGSRK